jgi:hypothetical protein
LIVCIEAARIGQDPHYCALEPLRLLADGGGLDAESVAVGSNAEEGDDARAIAPDLGRETLASGEELGGCDLLGAGRRPVDEIGDAVAVAQQLALLGWMQQARAEAGAMQRRPETVARTGEVMPGKRGIQARIDADEERAQLRRDDVADSLILGSEELSLVRPGG